MKTEQHLRYSTSLVFALLIATVISACGYAQRSSYPDSPFHSTEMFGVWESEEGTLIEIRDDGTFLVANLAGDIWSRNLTAVDTVSMAGTWQFCDQERGNSKPCDPTADGKFLTVYFSCDTISVDGAVVERNSGINRIDVTGDRDDRRIWFMSDPDDSSNKRYQYTKT